MHLVKTVFDRSRTGHPPDGSGGVEREPMPSQLRFPP